MVDYFLRHRAASYLMTVVLLAGGALSFLGMGQLEFPEFTIRNALITTQYPGASGRYPARFARYGCQFERVPRPRSPAVRG